MSYAQLAQHIQQDMSALHHLSPLERHAPAGQDLVSRLAENITQRGKAEQAIADLGKRLTTP